MGSARLGVAAVAAAVLALCFGGAAGSQSTAAFDGAQLSVGTATVGGQPELAIGAQMQDALEDGQAPSLAASIDVAVPAAYGLSLTGAPGTTLGEVVGVLVAADGSDVGLALGDLLVDDPATWAADPTAQACAPGMHTALWRANLSLLTGNAAASVPIAVDALPGSGYVIRVCPTSQSSSAFPQGSTLVSTSLLIAGVVTPPATAGSYRWSALVTPVAPGSFAPQPSSAFELRAVDRQPNVLAMHARFDSKTNTIAVSGRVLAAGSPWGGAPVSITAQTSSSATPVPLGTIPAAHDGSFFARVPASESETISASVSLDAHACTGVPSTAPAGCLSETDTAPPTAYATVVVPRTTDPQFTVRTADQARADTSVLRLADLPGGLDAGAGPLPCAGFAPNLHRLTVTGEADSDVYLSGDQKSAAFASASVLRTVDEARTDYTGVAQLAALRCEVKALLADEKDDHVLGVGPLRIPRVAAASRAYRAQISDPDYGRLTIDVLFVRAGRTVITLHTYTYGSTNRPLDLRLAQALATRAVR